MEVELDQQGPHRVPSSQTGPHVQKNTMFKICEQLYNLNSGANLPMEVR